MPTSSRDIRPHRQEEGDWEKRMGGVLTCHNGMMKRELFFMDTAKPRIANEAA